MSKKTGISEAMAFRPSALKVPIQNCFPRGGIWTNSLRPSQNMKVAIAMSTPGMPKAIAPPYRSPVADRISGVNKVEVKAPKLIEK